MASEEDKRNRILDFAFKKFTTTGVSQVTMDDLARGIGMGKGTLYKFFPSKEELLMHTVDFFAARMEKSLEKIFEDEKSTPADRLSLFLKTVSEKLSRINPATITYLERSMPVVYEKIYQTRNRMIMNNLLRIFREGKKSGLFRADMDENLVAHIVIGAIGHITEAQVLSTLNYSMDNLFNAVTSTIFKGCLTEEGKRVTYPNFS